MLGARVMYSNVLEFILSYKCFISEPKIMKLVAPSCRFVSICCRVSYLLQSNSALCTIALLLNIKGYSAIFGPEKNGLRID